MMIRVLVADESADMRQRLRVLLESYPEFVVVGDASAGQQALNHIQSLQPEVVIMDVSIPGLNGISITERLMELSPETRVIILSMQGEPEHVYPALQAGAQGYLLKESVDREVVEAVLSVYAGKVYLSPPVSKALMQDYLQQRGDPG
jgi:two-component system, NarL family, response regulator NreC